MPPAASLRSRVPPFLVMDILRSANERAAAGERVIHLEVGQPQAGAPAAVLQRAREALSSHRLGYTDALGLPSLRARIARHYGEAYGVEVDPGRVIVTTGSSAAFLLAFLSAFDPGDRVAIAAPGYPAYRHILSALGCAPVLLPVGPETRYQPDAAMIADAARDGLAGVVIASPANPTGSMMSRAALADVTAATRAAGARLVSDEIYHGVTYDFESAETALALDDEAIVINSFSKYYAMTGWRLGWMIAPEPLARPIERLAQNLYLSPPTLPQIAGEAAFDCSAELDRNVAGYAANRAALLEALPRLGLTAFAPPDGAFYLYFDVSERAADSETFCRRLLADTGVAITPGVDFDPLEGRRFVRLCYAGSGDEIAYAIDRIGRWL